MLIYGRRPLEILLASKSQHNFQKLLLQKGRTPEWLEPFAHIIERLPRENLSKQELDKRCKDGNHQGAAISLEGFSYLGQQDLKNIPPGKPGDFFIALDQIHDPHNLGAIARSALQFGAGESTIQQAAWSWSKPCLW